MEIQEFQRITARLNEKFEETKKPWWVKAMKEIALDRSSTDYCNWVDDQITGSRQYPLPITFLRFISERNLPSEMSDLPMGCAECWRTGFVWAIKDSYRFVFVCDCNERYAEKLKNQNWSRKNWEELGYKKISYEAYELNSVGVNGIKKTPEEPQNKEEPQKEIEAEW